MSGQKGIGFGHQRLCADGIATEDDRCQFLQGGRHPTGVSGQVVRDRANLAPSGQPCIGVKRDDDSFHCIARLAIGHVICRVTGQRHMPESQPGDPGQGILDFSRGVTARSYRDLIDGDGRTERLFIGINAQTRCLWQVQVTRGVARAAPACDIHGDHVLAGPDRTAIGVGGWWLPDAAPLCRPEPCRQWPSRTCRCRWASATSRISGGPWSGHRHGSA